MSSVLRDQVRILVSEYKSIQKVRLENALRIRDLSKRNVSFHGKEELENLVKNLKKVEQKIYFGLKTTLSGFPVWSEWMEHVAGCGPISAGYVIGWLDPDKPSPSHWWRYCGLSVVDGKAEKKSRGSKATFNPKLKAAMWNLSKSFVARGEGYRRAFEKFFNAEREKSERMAETPVSLSEVHVGLIYYDGKEWRPVKQSTIKKVREPVPVKLSDAHIYMRAMRKTVKLFLSHAWTVWRLLENKPIKVTYAKEKYGHTEYVMPIYDEEEKPEWWHNLAEWVEKQGMTPIEI